MTRLSQAAAGTSQETITISQGAMDGVRAQGGGGGGATYLNSVDADPGRHQSQNSSHQVNELCGLIVAVQALLPQLIQPCSPNHQSRINLHSKHQMPLSLQTTSSCEKMTRTALQQLCPLCEAQPQHIVIWLPYGQMYKMQAMLAVILAHVTLQARSNIEKAAVKAAVASLLVHSL